MIQESDHGVRVTGTEISLHIKELLSFKVPSEQDKKKIFITNFLLYNALDEEQLSCFSLENYIIYSDNVEVVQVACCLSQAHILTAKITMAGTSC